MPTISQFFGIIIQMFWREHAPPHFHAMYAEHEAQIDILTLEVIVGYLPKRALNLTIEWAIEHRSARNRGQTTFNFCQPPDPQTTEGATTRNPRRSKGLGGFAVSGAALPAPTFAHGIGVI